VAEEKTTKASDLPLVVVEWTDAQSRSSWDDIDEALDKKSKIGAKCFTAGFLSRQDKSGVVLYMTKDEDEDGNTTEMGNRWEIPAKWLIKVRKF